MRHEMQPRLNALLAGRQAQQLSHAEGGGLAEGGPALLTPALRMRGTTGGGGGSDLGVGGLSLPEKPWKKRHAIPHTPHRPHWMVISSKSEASLPGLPKVSASRVAVSGGGAPPSGGGRRAQRM